MIKRELYMKTHPTIYRKRFSQGYDWYPSLWKIRYARTNKRRIKSIRC